jgi:hypothetical protein
VTESLLGRHGDHRSIGVDRLGCQPGRRRAPTAGGGAGYTVIYKDFRVDANGLERSNLLTLRCFSTVAARRGSCRAVAFGRFGRPSRRTSTTTCESARHFGKGLLAQMLALRLPLPDSHPRDVSLVVLRLWTADEPFLNTEQN